MSSNSGFERREEGFEAGMHLEGEQRFRLEMKRDKLFAIWAASQLGMDDAETEAYQATLCKEDLTEPGDDDVVRRVMTDFAAKDLDVAEDVVRAKLQECWQDAVKADG